MKRFKKIICLAAVLVLLGLAAQSALAADLATIKIQGKKQCDSLKGTLSDFMTKLNSTDNYTNLGSTTTIDLWMKYPGVQATDRYYCQIRNQKLLIWTKINDLKSSTSLSSLDNICLGLENSPNTTVALDYTKKISNFNNNYIPMVKLADRVEDYTYAYRRLYDSVEYIKKFKAQVNSAGSPMFLTTAKSEDPKYGSTTKEILANDSIYFWNSAFSNNSSTGTFLETIGTTTVGISGKPICSTTPTYYYYMFTYYTSIDQFKSSLTDVKKRFDGCLRDMNGTVTAKMNNIMAETAKLNVAIGNVNSELQYHKTYEDMLNKYNEQRDKLAAALDKRIEAEKVMMTTYLNKLNAAASFNMLSQGVTTALKTGVNDRLTQLNGLRTAFQSIYSYQDANKQTADIEALNIKKVAAKNIDLAIKFNKSFTKASDTAAVIARFDKTYSGKKCSARLIDDGLMKDSDKTRMQSLINSFNAVAHGSASVIGQKLGIENAITNNASVSANVAGIDTLNTLLKKFDKDSNDVSKKVQGYRSEWWTMIEAAAIEHQLTSAQFDNCFGAEQKAAKIIADYNKKRAGYLAKAAKLIESRKVILAENKILMDACPDITAPIKDPLKNWTIMLLADSSTPGSLSKYYVEQIEAVDNYDELIAAVNSIKTDFKLNEVIIPLQKYYLQLDTYYNNNADLFAIRNNLKTRVNKLVNASEVTKAQKDKMNALMSSIETDQSQLWGNNSTYGMLWKMNKAMDDALDSLSESGTKAVNDLGSAIKSKIKTIKSNESSLLKLVTANEKLLPIVE